MEGLRGQRRLKALVFLQFRYHRVVVALFHSKNPSHSWNPSMTWNMLVYLLRMIVHLKTITLQHLLRA